jgi:GAF domain-containing protein
MEPTDVETDNAAVLAMAAAFADVVEGLFSASGVHATLAQIVEFSVATIEGCEFAGIFIRDQGVVTTPISTDPIVVEVDALQHACHEGPCLDAISEGLTFYADELGSDPRWPKFGPEAAAVGMRSLLALPLITDGTFGALNLYSRYPQAFGVIDRARGLLLASMAKFALSVAHVHADQDRRAEDLQAALLTREMIGQAEGILIERERLTPNQAFHVLRKASQHLNLKLRDVAQGLVETGERPDTGSR